MTTDTTYDILLKTYFPEGKKFQFNLIWPIIRETLKIIREANKTIFEQNKRIRELEAQLTIDELTGLMNRKGFEHAFTKELDRVNRDPNATGLLIAIDLDLFKKINDKFGHLAGDACLRTIAKTLHENCRTMDSAVRLGGDEFILLLPGANRKKALKRIITLTSRLANLTLDWNGIEIPFTASLGIHEYKAGDSTQSALHQADMALYSSKNLRKIKAS